MKNFNLSFTAREIHSEPSYSPMEEYGLQYTYNTSSGEGTSNSPYCCNISITNKNAAPWEGVLHIAMKQKRFDPQIFMPGFMYGTNRGDMPMEGLRACPKIRKELSKPASPWWMVRGDRLSHPTALVADNNRIYGFHASPYWTTNNNTKCSALGRDHDFLQYAGFTCNAYTQIQDNTEYYCEVGYTIGYENAPWLFIESQDVRDRAPLKEQCIYLDTQETIHFTMYLYDFNSTNLTDINRIIQNVYLFYHEMPNDSYTVKDSVKALAEAVSDYAWISRNNSYSLFVFNSPGSDEMELRELGSFSWTNGLSIATPMLMSAIRLKNQTMKTQAISCIDSIVKNCINPSSGLPYDGFMNDEWTLKGWWYDCLKNPGHTGYIIGQGIYYIIKAYSFLLETCNEKHDEWLTFAKAVITILEKQRNTEGEYPYLLSGQTGAGIEYDSLGSIWCMAATLKYIETTNDTHWLEAIQLSEQHYYTKYVAKCQCYGGPFDITKNIDSEGILAYIRSVAILHRLTGNAMYLEHLKNGIEYEFSFKFCYNSPVNVPPLSTARWCSCGGSITSVVNPHIHPMSSSIVDELAYYVSQTNDPYVQSRLNDTISWGCQTYNHFDKEYDYGKKGWMSERFCYSEGLLKEHYPNGNVASTWFALMPWANASILEGLTGWSWDRKE